MRKELRSYQILAILGKVILINFKEKMLNIRIDNDTFSPRIKHN
jgi:hypothetical protein